MKLYLQNGNFESKYNLLEYHCFPIIQYPKLLLSHLLVYHQDILKYLLTI